MAVDRSSSASLRYTCRPTFGFPNNVMFAYKWARQRRYMQSIGRLLSDSPGQHRSVRSVHANWHQIGVGSNLMSTIVIIICRIAMQGVMIKSTRPACVPVGHNFEPHQIVWTTFWDGARGKSNEQSVGGGPIGADPWICATGSRPHPCPPLPLRSSVPLKPARESGGAVSSPSGAELGAL